MRVRVQQPVLREALGIVRPAVATRSTLPILANVVLSATDRSLTVSATNLELCIEHTITGADIEQTGAITVPVRLLSDFVRNLPAQEVTLALDGLTLAVTCAGFEAHINGISAQEFPLIDVPDDLNRITLDRERFAGLVQSVTPAASRDPNYRPVLTGVLVSLANGRIEMNASDGFRLHRRVEPCDYHGEILTAVVPAQTLVQIAKCADGDTVDLAVSGVRAFARSGNTRIVSQLIEGEYPDLSHTIPENQRTMAILPLDELQQATRMAQIFARDASDRMRLDLAPPNACVITAQSAEDGDNSSELEARVEGEPVDIALNTHYVLDALNAIDTASVRMALTGSATAVTMRPEYGHDTGVRETVCVIMPMYLGH